MCDGPVRRHTPGSCCLHGRRRVEGIETLAGIPGSVGAAVYGNAGAYGHSLSEAIRTVRFADGETIRTFSNAQCEFFYRESVFKRHKDWIIFSVEMALEPAPREELQRVAADILRVRNEKFPPTMKCAGSIFKNLLLDELPATVRARVHPAWRAKGRSRGILPGTGWSQGDAGGQHARRSYHANLIYNDGAGTARQLVELIRELKSRVRTEFGLTLEEEVQYVGFAPFTSPAS